MMFKILFLLIVVASLFFISCGPNVPNVTFYKGIEGAEIPNSCVQYANDVCGLFDCMVDQCWCDDSSPELPILYETLISFNDEQGAKDAVNAYIAELTYGEIETDIENLEEMKVTKAVRLNNIFYNVFVDFDSEEEVYTVAVDGSVFLTQCGV